METLAYPHLTLAHNPQSDPPVVLASLEGMAALPDLVTNWFQSGQLGRHSKLSSAGWVACLSMAVATSSWVMATAAIAQVPGDSGLSFTESQAAPAPDPAATTDEQEFEPLPDLQINREPPKSLAQFLNEASMGFLGGDGAFREDVRQPVNPDALPDSTQQLPPAAPPAATFGVPGSLSTDPINANRSGNLRLGMRSPRVSQLQTQLNRLGFFQGRSDGYFGNNTLNAVKAFQRNRGLVSDGVVGVNTRAALYGAAGSGGAPITTTRRTTAPRSVPQGIPPRTVSQPAPPRTTGSICDRYYTRIGHRDVRGAGNYAGGCNIPCVGSKNQNVVALQNRLKTLGYFKFHSTGYYGPITRNAVIRFQRANGLRPDGVAGPLTKRALALNF